MRVVNFNKPVMGNSCHWFAARVVRAVDSIFAASSDALWCLIVLLRELCRNVCAA